MTGPWGESKAVDLVTDPTLRDRFQTHSLKVIPPYWRAIADGDKAFEVRRNDRGFQRGDMLYLTEWHPPDHGDQGCHECRNSAWSGHYPRDAVTLQRWVSFVYAGDPRFGGIEPGFVVLGLSMEGLPPDA